MTQMQDVTVKKNVNQFGGGVRKTGSYAYTLEVPAPALICSWLNTAGFRVASSKVLNLVPIFFPDWMARVVRIVGPLVKRLPLLRDIACGQRIIVARR